MSWFVGQSLVVIVAAFLVGLLVGWLLWGRARRSEAEPAASIIGGATTTSDRADGAVGVVETVAESRSAATPEPAVEAEPAPESVVEPVVAVEPEPEPEAVPLSGPDVVADVEPEPVAEPERAAVVEAEPVSASGVVAASEPAAVAESEPAAEPEPVAVAEPAVVAEPESVDGAVVPGQRTAVADDLKRIEGIGPKMAGALQAAGIRTFAQLAASDVTVIKAAISAAGMRTAPSLSTWPEQARLLAEGDEDGFAALTGRLVSSRGNGRR